VGERETPRALCPLGSWNPQALLRPAGVDGLHPLVVMPHVESHESNYTRTQWRAPRIPVRGSTGFLSMFVVPVRDQRIVGRKEKREKRE
jgi:hypothetical protein